MTHPVWDPALYARHSDERARPGFELMARLGALPEGAIADLGCGAGGHLIALVERYPARAATGVDLSPDMLAAARAKAPDLAWVEADIGRWRPEAPLALLFSNAALQWLPDHRALIPRLCAILAPGGWFAAQMPAMAGSPGHIIAAELCAERRPHAAAGLFDPAWVLSPPHYHDLLAAAGMEAIDIWETTYWHRLGPEGVTGWMIGTALRPILSALGEADRATFLAAYDEQVRTAYPPQPDGVILYPQRRLFLVAQRALHFR